MNSNPHIVIIGAGVSGLAAGVMLRKAGFAVDIYERERTPGGLACGWNRKGYHIEGAIHWMIGCFPGSMVYPIWKEIGALRDNNPATAEDPPLTLMRKDAPLIWHRDLQRTESELLAYSPADADAIRRLIADIRLYKGLTQQKRGITLRALLRAWPLLRMSAGEYAARFSDPDLRALVGSVISPYHNAFSMMYVLGAFAAGEGGYPEGGATRLVDNIVERYLSLGGKLHLQQAVERIIVEDGCARGLIVNGEAMPADCVLVASDTRQAIDHLFEQPLRSRWADKLRQRTLPNEVTFIALGVRASLQAYPHTMRFRLDEPIKAAGHAFDVLSVYNYSTMPQYAPPGCTTLTVLLFSPTFGYWQQAKADGSYQAKKKAIAEAVIKQLETLIPETKGQVEMTDVATPLTYARYCDTYAGSIMNVWQKNAWPLLVPNRCKEISGLYFCGQRTLISGGLPIAAISAKNAVRKMIKSRR